MTKDAMKKMRVLFAFVCLFALTGSVVAQEPSEGIRVVVEPSASSAERLAAQELETVLRRLYPAASGKSVRLAANLPVPESYAITATENEAVIAGGGPRGVVYGVYALLEKLGCGFYLSGDAIPSARKEPLSFKDCNLADKPLVPTRLVFDWHNFLSGCSTWNLPEWQSWIRQSQKMGYNAIMVHAYGNNPMVSFTFNGKTKPVGYLSTTVRGRDWSTMHVNDVRLLIGGGVFSQPVFGADAAQGAEEQRADAARKLMQGVFASAGERAMEVYFADDVDTGSANPQELIQTLPEGARFAVQTQAGGMTGVSGNGSHTLWLANPDTPEGYRFYKAQVAELIATYPQITCLVVWFRGGGTPWMDLKVAEMPPRWQEEYNAAINRTPAAAKFWHAQNMFAIGKITRAFDRALKELGHDRVRLAAGTWNFAFLPGADLFFQPNLPLIGLDYGVLHDDSKLGTAEKRQVLAEVGAHRPLIPVIWAHHDDGNYIGRPYTPFADFHAKLVEAKASGFGIIHWTTRPLDLFFASHIRQVWQRTENQPLRATCDDMAAKMFGAPLGAYLERWVTDAPKFARETSDHFIDRPLTNVAEIVAGCRGRTALLGAGGNDNVNYYRGLEAFIAAFYRTHEQFQNAETLWKKGDLASARVALAECRPEPVIEQFATFSSLGGMTRGEQGLLVSLNTRWLVYFVRLRQALGMEAVRYNFGPTSHDPLAQAAGAFTYFFDTWHQIWQTLGAEETGAETFDAPSATEEIGRHGLQSDKPITLTVRPIIHKAALPAGEYRLRLLLLDPESTAAGQRVFNVAVGGAAGEDFWAFAPVKTAYLRLACHGTSENDWNSIYEVRLDSLAADASVPRVTASGAVSGYPAERVIDGDVETRWAARGVNHWLQFRLNPQAVTEQIGIAWFAGDKRKAKFEILTSADGQQWSPVQKLHRVSAPATMCGTVDIFKEVGGANRLIERIFPVTLRAPGEVTVTLTPVKGKAVISGVVLERVEGATK